jgi:N-methylhydantoinase B/oxoprolinase/acetone carboxylase alpha subunit
MSNHTEETGGEMDKETNIIWKRLQATSDEMFRAIRRLAFGFAIREADDASSVITTPTGDAVGVSRQSVPVLVGAVPSAIRDIFENHYPPEDLEPGDVIITNDPWIGGGHLLDIVVITPIFYEGELVGLAGSLGNVDDIGGLSGAWVTEGEIEKVTEFCRSQREPEYVEDVVLEQVTLDLEWPEEGPTTGTAP